VSEVNPFLPSGAAALEHDGDCTLDVADPSVRLDPELRILSEDPSLSVHSALDQDRERAACSHPGFDVGHAVANHHACRQFDAELVACPYQQARAWFAAVAKEPVCGQGGLRMVRAEEESVDVCALLGYPPGKFFVLRRNVKFGKTPPSHGWLICDDYDEPASLV
jgi:hypothetical protein